MWRSSPPSAVASMITHFTEIRGQAARGCPVGGPGIYLYSLGSELLCHTSFKVRYVWAGSEVPPPLTQLHWGNNVRWLSCRGNTHPNPSGAPSVAAVGLLPITNTIKAHNDVFHHPQGLALSLTTRGRAGSRVHTHSKLADLFLGTAPIAKVNYQLPWWCAVTVKSPVRGGL